MGVLKEVEDGVVIKGKCCCFRVVDGMRYLQENGVQAIDLWVGLMR